MSTGEASTPSNNILDNHPRNKEYPRSPSSISPASSRRESLRSKNTDPPTPNSPRLSRKRAASLDTDAASHPRIQDLALTGGRASEPKVSMGRDHVCLCQPDPKIPRPRNAFILYRQHYQAQVVAQHPGLANPEISKIIGEQWRDQPIEVKNDWKRLAEEEKQRHQRQYPDYRYQPRRAGKTTGTRPTITPGEETPRCPKCGGRSISTPSTPLNAFSPSFSAGAPRSVLQPPFSAAQGSPSVVRRSEPFDRAPFPTTTAALRTPHPYTESQMHRRSQQQYAPQSAGLPTRDREEDIEMMSPSTPYKRRRFEGDGYNRHPQHSRQPSYPPTPSSYPPQQHLLQRSRQPVPAPAPPASALSYPTDHRGAFQVQGYHQTGPGAGSGLMDPPPRPSQYGYHSQQQPYPLGPTQPSPRNPNASFDESLRLPPLQTQIQHQSRSNTELSSTRLANAIEYTQVSRSLSVQAMVMTIPYLNKIKVLAKISQPLAAPGPTSPAHDLRGTVIAVEGADEALVAEVGRFLEECLGRERECLVRIWGLQSASPERNVGYNESRKSPRDMEMGGVSSEVAGLRIGAPALANSADFQAYLAEIQKWHVMSAEIAKFITTSPTPMSTLDGNPTPALTPAAGVTDSGEALSPKSMPTITSITESSKDKGINPSKSTTANTNPPSPSPSTSTIDTVTGRADKTTSSGPSATPPSNLNTQRPTIPIPVALLPSGFSLSISDTYASRIPINDAYAPVDHWQWMATLWRGIIGPDLTIYVKTVDTSVGPSGFEPSAGSAVPGSAGIGQAIGSGGQGIGQAAAGHAASEMSGREEMARFGGVEIRHDCRAVIVRAERNGTSVGPAGSGSLVEEKTLRRLGFEVLEFVRSEAGFGRR